MQRVYVLKVSTWAFVAALAALATTGGDRALNAAPQAAAPAGPTRAAAPGMTPETGRAVIQRYCVTCHNARMKTGNLTLEGLDLSNVPQNAPVLEQVVRKLRAGVMPPMGLPRPDDATHQQLVGWLETQLDAAAAAHPNPGRKEAFHRLNRAEYHNAVRDLLALDVDVSELLPADDGSFGFDNMAGAMRIDQSRMERYLTAAQKISSTAMGGAIPPRTKVYSINPETNQYSHVDDLPFGTRGGRLFHHYFPRDGEYTIKAALMCPREVDLKCDGYGGYSETHELEISLDGMRVGHFTIEAREQRDGYLQEWDDVLKVTFPIKAGPHDVAVSFVKTIPSVEYVRDGYWERFQKPLRYYADPVAVAQPHIDTVTITGPFNSTGPGDTPSRKQILVCTPATAQEEAPCAAKILTQLARRAYRRPVAAGDVQELMKFYELGRKEGLDFQGGVEAALRRLLVSPQFLYRVERDPAKVDANGNYRLSGMELASRLSFFLWSSIPDDELLAVATRGELSSPRVLEAQVRRMLADSRSEALTQNFLGQWLELRNLEAKRPSEFVFPNFDETLRDAFRTETEMFFEHLVREDLSVLEMLTADYTFINERLATHYGIPRVKGAHYRKVTYPDDKRRGILGHGSILMVTSHANRTSPVLRGKWVLANLLGTPAPNPPANVPPLDEKAAKEGKALSIREKMAAHRANPVCASCHSMIDPSGFALENFNAVGQWRDVDEGFNPIDAAGQLPDGAKFSGLDSFRAAVLRHPERFVSSLTERLMTYTLGRGVDYYDMPEVRQIVRKAGTSNYRFRTLVMGIVTSPAFQMRKAAAATQVAAVLPQ